MHRLQIAQPACKDISNKTIHVLNAMRQHAGWASTEGHAGQAPMLRARHARASRC